MFQCRPSTHPLSPPSGTVSRGELVLTFDIKSELDRELAEIRKHVAWQLPEIERHNQGLRAAALERLERRRQKLVADQAVTANLGLPVRR